MSIEDIDFLESRIETALESNNFTEVASLAYDLETKIRMLIENSNSDEPPDTLHIERVKGLLANVKKFEQKTIENFKKYTTDISQKTKMHAAYKENGN